MVHYDSFLMVISIPIIISPSYHHHITIISPSSYHHYITVLVIYFVSLSPNITRKSHKNGSPKAHTYLIIQEMPKRRWSCKKARGTSKRCWCASKSAEDPTINGAGWAGWAGWSSGRWSSNQKNILGSGWGIEHGDILEMFRGNT